ncbi:MAG: hypothetical protein AAGH88_08930 [Planctomycetota bacterium]
MAWRPSSYLIEGELDNTAPGRVTGWMIFKGLEKRVTFDLAGDFHRDIRGAKLRLFGDGERADTNEAAAYLHGMSRHQTGQAGDITAGRAPQDYGDYPYIEWYGQHNGRVVIELDRDAVEVIGRPIPWIESDPISRAGQQQNMAAFLGSLVQEISSSDHTAASQTPPESVPDTQPASDPGYTHWVIENGVIVGEAREIEPIDDQLCIAYVRLFRLPEQAEYGRIAIDQLRLKHPAR